ncbi:MAG: hypothetical protein AABX47_05020 [Nanoarchaeota archaeon]
MAIWNFVGITTIAFLILSAHAVFGASVADYGGSRLIASDSTDSSPSGITQPVVFYAQFMNASTGASIDGSCNLSISRVNVSNLAMTFNGSGDSRFNYTYVFLFAGDTQYNITCLAPALGPVTASDSASAAPTSNLTIQAPAFSDAPNHAHFNVTYLNSSDGAAISGATCVMYFQESAGNPLAPLMVFNSSTNRHEHRRAFYSGGNFTYNSSCTAPNFEQGFAAGSILIRRYLPNASRFDSVYTTNFSLHSSVDSIDLTLSNQYGYVHWLSNMNATLRDFDSNVWLGNNFISINTTGLGPEYNSSVEIVLRGATSYQVVLAPGLYYQASQLRSSGIPCGISTSPICSNVAIIGSTVSFRASFPTSFALGADANISTRTNGPVARYTPITVFANYSNSSNGAPILNSAPHFSQCTITFSPLAGAPLNSVMTYDPVGIYMFSRDINYSGTFEYNITCESDTFSYMQTSGSFVSVAAPAPAASVVPAAVQAPPAPAPAPPATVPDVPLGPVPSASEGSPSKTLIATSGGLTASLDVGDEVDVSVNGVTIIASIESTDGSIAKARLGSERASISQGQELLMDVDKDGNPDVSMKLIGIAKDSAKVVIKKLRGSDGASASDSPAEDSSSTGKAKPQPIDEPIIEESGPSWWWFVLIFVVLMLIGKWYFRYNQRMRRGFV